MKYTPAEVAALLANRPNQPHYVKALIEKCVKAAVLAEREACAQVCETTVWSKDVKWWMEATKTQVSAEAGQQCAAAIRARSLA